MRANSIVLLIFHALFATAQQPAADNLVSSGKLSIPARLTKTVSADKAHPGGPVEFRTLEPVLLSKDLVMPENTLLRGRVLSAGPKQEGKNSWLALVVERAEWKQHSLSLHAFIAAQITISPTSNQRPPELGSTGNPSSLRTSRQSARLGARDDPTLSNIIKPPQDATGASQDGLNSSHSSLENIGLLRDKNGTIYLVSSKTNVKLPAGLMFMLKNEPAGSSETADTKTASNASVPDRRP